jgi:hypothetical protein
MVAVRPCGRESTLIASVRECVLSYTVAIVPQAYEAKLSRGERTDSGKAITDQIKKHVKAIQLQLLDKGGLPTAVYELPMDGFIRIYSNSDERPTTLEDRGMLACTPASYLRADTLKLSWTERRE